MSNGSKIADQINAALLQAAKATGDGPFIAVLEKPGAKGGTLSKPTYGAPTTHSISALDGSVKLKDASGTLTGQTKRFITLAATGIVPAKSDRIQIKGSWFEIDTVEPTAPGGVDLMYKITLVN